MMPRVSNSGINVDLWYERVGEASSTHDVCKGCHQKLEKDPNRFNHILTPYQREEPQGVDGWEGDVDHPPYSECDYQCTVCGKKLTSRDD